jgi:hypothetical protein
MNELETGDARIARLILVRHTKIGKNIPDNIKTYQISYNVPNGIKMHQTDIKYTDIFHSKAQQNIPKSGFLLMLYHLATRATQAQNIMT